MVLLTARNTADEKQEKQEQGGQYDRRCVGGACVEGGGPGGGEGGGGREARICVDHLMDKCLQGIGTVLRTRQVCKPLSSQCD